MTTLMGNRTGAAALALTALFAVGCASDCVVTTVENLEGYVDVNGTTKPIGPMAAMTTCQYKVKERDLASFDLPIRPKPEQGAKNVSNYNRP